MEGASDERCRAFRRARRARPLERHGIATSRRRISRITGGGRPGQHMLEEEALAFRLEAELGPAAEPARQALRRARAPHPCRRQPDVRVHRAEVELRLPAGRPLQPRGRRALDRRQAQLRPGKGADSRERRNAMDRGQGLWWIRIRRDRLREARRDAGRQEAPLRRARARGHGLRGGRPRRRRLQENW